MHRTESVLAEGVRPFWPRLIALVLCFVLACGSNSTSSDARSGRSGYEDEDAIRYRLLLRHNPVDPGEAFRCYGRCQQAESPQGYLECLTECPGFELTDGMRCAKTEVPPLAACITARKVRTTDELSPGWVVVAVLANVLIVVTLASLCTSSPSQCGIYGPNYLPPPR